MVKNASGYNDPTCSAVMSKMMAEYKAEQRQISRRRIEIKDRPKVYVVSSYAGDVDANVAAARRYCRMVALSKRIPIASHLLYPQFLDDNDPKERELGTMFGMALLALCDEVWVFGSKRSPGMQAEIVEAKRLHKPLRYLTEKAEVQHEND